MSPHLAEVLQTLLASKDPDALAKFESTSLEVKAKHFKPTIGVTVRRRHPAPELLPEPKLRSRSPPTVPPHLWQAVPPAVEDDTWKKRSNALFTVRLPPHVPRFQTASALSPPTDLASTGGG